MVEPGKYINNVEKSEHSLTIKEYTRLPHEHRNEITNPFKTSAPLTHALVVVIS